MASLDASTPEQLRDDDNIPSWFLCSITQDIMVDPVSTIDGQTYERAAIAMWFENNQTSPNTNEVLEDNTLIPNYALKSAIEEYNKNKARPNVGTAPTKNNMPDANGPDHNTPDGSFGGGPPPPAARQVAEWSDPHRCPIGTVAVATQGWAPPRSYCDVVAALAAGVNATVPDGSFDGSDDDTLSAGGFGGARVSVTDDDGASMESCRTWGTESTSMDERPRCENGPSCTWLKKNGGTGCRFLHDKADLFDPSKFRTKPCPHGSRCKYLKKNGGHGKCNFIHESRDTFDTSKLRTVPCQHGARCPYVKRNGGRGCQFFHPRNEV